MRRAEDLIMEDAISPNILKKLRGGAERLARVMRSSFTDIGSMQASHGYRSPYWNFITVAKQGGDFQTITEALIAIEDNSDLNRYCIFVYPGLYDEQVVMKEYVALVGLDKDVCIIQSGDYTDLVTMANNSSLNEAQVINERSTTWNRAIVVENITDILLDGIIAKASHGVSIATFALYALGCSKLRVMGSSEFYTKTGSAGSSRPIYLAATSTNALVAEIKNCRAEILAGGSGAGILINPSDSYGAVARILASHIITQNPGGKLGYGVRAGGGGGEAANASVYVIACDIEEAASGGGGYNLYADPGGGGSRTIYVRGTSYSSWATTSGGYIIPLAGDRPRLECTEQTTGHTITAGADVWQNTNCTLNINLPCESDLKVACFIRWRSDVARTLSAGFRIDLDGASQAGTTAYMSEDVASNWVGTTLVACFSNVATGVHTITVQAQRSNAGDTVTLGRQNLSVESIPWP